ncbi:recombination-associated protein RdgC [Marinospirillum alkaliphilum]|uniref:Recombination-associated protein RdgC n=1 Tax=Marinospirillum alkaliphilum DSM 21637 TaxID=1122209 RepID=A0A1K1TJT5_9GAMM|nr:recombination-associated protein RdgC [Marinospirillum alkaliphilum]SFX00798.1 recombination associated protein RdgC [Marinospirillum alkaliphilum DSM 21637]
MWFKALRIYQARTPQNWNSDKLEQALAVRPFRHCGSQEDSTAGWVSPAGGKLRVHSQGDHWLLKLKIEEKILPSTVVREQLQERIEALEAEEQRRVGRKERQNLAEELRLTLLPQAFTRSRHLWVWLDGQNNRVMMDTTSDKQAELALNLLREGLGSLPVVPLNTQLAPVQVMTGWVAEGGPSDFELLDSCELRDAEDEQSVMRCKGQDLASDEIRQLLEAGKRVTQLRLDWQQQVNFTLTDQLTLKSLNFAEQLLEEAADVNPDQDPLIALDAEFILMSNTLSALIDRLLAVHQGLSDNLLP